MGQSWSGSDVIHHTKDRGIWGAMIFNVGRQGTYIDRIAIGDIAENDAI